MVEINKNYTISEASELIGYPNHVLRFYEKEFDIEIPRNRSGHRYYTYNEIEKFTYIKNLKERGWSNKQIKTIINSPEEIMNIDELAVTSSSYSPEMGGNILPIKDLENNLSSNIIEIGRILEEKLDDSLKDLSKVLAEKIQSSLQDFKIPDRDQDKDVLISENARLRMKLKERTYETAALKQKLKQLENKKVSFFSRIFGDANKEA